MESVFVGVADLTENTVTGISVGNAVGGIGIFVKDCAAQQLQIEENVIKNNEGSGLYTEGSTVQLQSNTAEYNELTGIYLGRKPSGVVWGIVHLITARTDINATPPRHWSGSAQAIKGPTTEPASEWVSSEQLHLFMVLGARR